MKIQTIFEAFERHQLGEEDPSQLLAEIVTKLPKVRLGCLLKMSPKFARLRLALVQSCPTSTPSWSPS